MKKFWQKSLIVVVLSVLALSAVLLCSCNEYDNKNITLYNDIGKYMNASFLEQNRTYGVRYSIDVYDDETDSWMTSSMTVKDAPSTRDFIVDTEEQFIHIFAERPIDINFESEMLIIHMFTDTNNRPVKLKEIIFENNKMEVYFIVQRRIDGLNDTTEPGQKCFAIKMKKTELTTVTFIRK